MPTVVCDSEMEDGASVVVAGCAVVDAAGRLDPLLVGVGLRGAPFLSASAFAEAPFLSASAFAGSPFFSASAFAAPAAIVDDGSTGGIGTSG